MGDNVTIPQSNTLGSTQIDYNGRTFLVTLQTEKNIAVTTPDLLGKAMVYPTALGDAWEIMFTNGTTPEKQPSLQTALDLVMAVMSSYIQRNNEKLNEIELWFSDNT